MIEENRVFRSQWMGKRASNQRGHFITSLRSTSACRIAVNRKVSKSAFLPQFVSSSEPYLAQVAMLSAVFWVLALTMDSGYALLADKVARSLQDRDLAQFKNGVTGILYLGAGATLAATKQGQ